MTWPTTCPELGGALNLWAGRGAQIPSKSLPPPKEKLVGTDESESHSYFRPRVAKGCEDSLLAARPGHQPGYRVALITMLQGTGENSETSRLRQVGY